MSGANVKVSLDTREFDRTFREYMRVTSRDLTTALNTKAYFIALRAMWNTKIADKSKIRETYRGKANQAIIGRILNKRRGTKGLPGLYGDAMREAVNMARIAATRAAGFLKSGWLPAIRILAPLAERRGSPRKDRRAKQYGKDQGGAKAARVSLRPSSMIYNAVTTTKDPEGTAGALMRFGQPALQAAFREEAASMRKYMADKLRKSARKLRIQTR